ncbi:MAG TPA: hypothetical protein VJ872_02090 [Nocardioides sp.]|nr:hypothetical protein [Nocardioides sp.]
MHLRRTRLLATLAAGALLLAACGSTDHDMNDMSGMPGMAHGDGLSSTSDGYTLALLSTPMSGMPMPLRFTITRDGNAVTDLVREQTKLLHLYLVRDDLSGFQHLHPVLSRGVWTVRPAALAPGSYRVFAQLTPRGADEPVVLSAPLDLGTDAGTPPVVPTGEASSNGWTVTLHGQPRNGSTLRMSIERNGRPFAGLQPYLDTYAHVSAFREGDLAFSHLHPIETVTSRPGGPNLDFMVEVPEPGTYRLFVQFRAGGVLHTVPVTTTVG